MTQRSILPAKERREHLWTAAEDECHFAKTGTDRSSKAGKGTWSATTDAPDWNQWPKRAKSMLDYSDCWMTLKTFCWLMACLYSPLHLLWRVAGVKCHMPSISQHQFFRFVERKGWKSHVHENRFTHIQETLGSPTADAPPPPPPPPPPPAPVPQPPPPPPPPRKLPAIVWKDDKTDPKYVRNISWGAGPAILGKQLHPSWCDTPTKNIWSSFG